MSRQTIEAKWEPLPPTCVERISQLLQGVERPVVLRVYDERKRMQASTAVHMVTRRLLSKISKGLPFPPGIHGQREDDFVFEKVLDNNRVLEAQLTLALHSNELLEAELAKETALLESESGFLAELEANAKSEASRRRQAGRRFHSLLQSEDFANEEEDLKNQIGLEVDQSSWSATISVRLSTINGSNDANSLLSRLAMMKTLPRLSRNSVVTWIVCMATSARSQASGQRWQKGKQLCNLLFSIISKAGNMSMSCWDRRSHQGAAEVFGLNR